MKEIHPSPPALVRNQFASVKELFDRYVVPSYGRFDLVLSHGAGSYVWDVAGERYLDLGGGIAVTSLGHAHPEVTEVLIEQAKKLTHVSNLYYQEPQGRLAECLVGELASGKVFFCNSGAEANEGLYKLARKFGHEEGRFEILTALNSFHGRTLAGIAATGQAKVKLGFEPIVAGFRQVAFNDLKAVREALSPATAAVMIEGVQGEGGITAATAEYLLGLRALCDEHNLLLLWDGIQCGQFRTGTFQSYRRILEGAPGGDSFLPDAVSMAKSLGGGFPIGAFWVRADHADLLGPGTHGTTYGGTPLACAVALKIMEIVRRDRLAENARDLGEFLKRGLREVADRVPGVIAEVRGLGLMLGFELDEAAGVEGDDRPASIQFVTALHEAGVLTVPAGARVVRLLPALNLARAQAEEGLEAIELVARRFAGRS